MNDKKAINVLFWLLVLFGINYPCFAIGNILLSSSNNAPFPGESIILEAVLSEPSDQPIFLGRTVGNSQFGDLLQGPLIAPPYKWTIQIPQTASGLQRYFASGEIGGNEVVSNEVQVVITPDFSMLQQIFFSPGNALVLFPGRTEQIEVFGRFSNGFNYHITEKELGTLYTENVLNGLNVSPGDSPVIDVSPDGIVLAIQPGEAEVVATNNGVSNVRRIQVVALRDDDFDGDDLTNDQEDAIGANKYHPDSDGDGSRDGVEVGANPAAPLNADNAGAIDALDNTVIAIRDASGQYVSLRTSAGSLSIPYGQNQTDFPDRPAQVASLNLVREVINFTVRGLTEGQSIDVTLYFDSLPASIDAYLKFGSRLPASSSPEWYEFPNFEVNGNRIILHLTDNQLGDSNPVPGVISDPGGPGTLDTDSDGIPDTYEDNNNLNKNDPNDAALDNDNDGLSNLEEFQNGTDPNDPASGPSAKPIPMLSEWGLIAVTLGLLLLSMVQLRKRSV